MIETQIDWRTIAGQLVTAIHNVLRCEDGCEIAHTNEFALVLARYEQAVADSEGVATDDE